MGRCRANGPTCIRALDGDGQWVDVRLSEYRDLDAGRAFFESARGVVGQRPKQVSTDGHTPYPRAIEETPGKRVEYGSICGLGNPIEQDHRGNRATIQNAGVQGVQDGRWFLPRV
jgi:transposase-like protein